MAVADGSTAVLPYPELHSARPPPARRSSPRRCHPGLSRSLEGNSSQLSKKVALCSFLVPESLNLLDCSLYVFFFLPFLDLSSFDLWSRHHAQDCWDMLGRFFQIGSAHPTLGGSLLFAGLLYLEVSSLRMSHANAILSPLRNRAAHRAEQPQSPQSGSRHCASELLKVQTLISQSLTSKWRVLPRGPSLQSLHTNNKENNIHIMRSDCFSRSYLAIESIPNHWVNTLQFLVRLRCPKPSLASTWPSQWLTRFDESSFPSHAFSHSMKHSRDPKTQCWITEVFFLLPMLRQLKGHRLSFRLSAANTTPDTQTREF